MKRNFWTRKHYHEHMCISNGASLWHPGYQGPAQHSIWQVLSQWLLSEEINRDV